MSDYEALGLSVLREAGWIPERHVAMDEHESAIAAAGYLQSDRISAFLAEYGGLAVGAPVSGFSEVIAIDPISAIATTSRATVEEYEELVSAPLIPVGAAYGGYLVVMMAADGRFFGGYDDYLVYAGQSPAELFGRIAAEQLEEVDRTS